MSFTHNGHQVQLQGISSNLLEEITSHQLRRLQTTRVIAGFYHMQMLDVTENTKPEIPVLVSPLLLEYQHLFQKPQVSHQRGLMAIRFT